MIYVIIALLFYMMNKKGGKNFDLSTLSDVFDGEGKNNLIQSLLSKLNIKGLNQEKISAIIELASALKEFGLFDGSKNNFLISDFFGVKKNSENKVPEFVISPICEIADKKINYLLNSYISNRV